MFCTWGTWYGCSMEAKKPASYQTHPPLSWTLLLAPSSLKAAIWLWDAGWLRAGFAASWLYVWFQPTEELELFYVSVYVGENIDERCFPLPRVFWGKVHEILDVLLLWGTDSWQHIWDKEIILVVAWSRCANISNVWSCAFLLMWESRRDCSPQTESPAQAEIFSLTQLRSHSEGGNNW